MLRESTIDLCESRSAQLTWAAINTDVLRLTKALKSATDARLFQRGRRAAGRQDADRLQLTPALVGVPSGSGLGRCPTDQPSSDHVPDDGRPSPPASAMPSPPVGLPDNGVECQIAGSTSEPLGP